MVPRMPRVIATPTRRRTREGGREGGGRGGGSQLVPSSHAIKTGLTWVCRAMQGLGHPQGLLCQLLTLVDFSKMSVSYTGERNRGKISNGL